MMIKNIQALRALAVMVVVLGHLQPLAQQVHPLLTWVGLGRAGVDLFFVISGFIMVYTTERESPSAAQFALRRLIRIVPLYWVVTLGVFALAILAPGLLGASRPEPVWLVKSLAFVPFDKGDGTTNPLIPVGWTLNYEMFFYACFAIALLIPRRSVSYVVAAAVIGGLGLVGFGQTFTEVLVNFYTRPILVEFALGIVLGLLFKRLPILSGTRSAQLGLAALLLLVVALAASGFAREEALRVAVAGTASVCVVGLALMLERGGWAVRNPLTLLIGNASYAIYLTHMFVTQAFIIAARKVGASDPVSSTLFLLAALFASVVAGVVMFLLYERPVGRLLRGLVAPRPVSVGPQSPAPTPQ